jgi:hypothetical protein
VERLTRDVGIEQDLSQAITVTQVDEDEAAEVSPTPHPSGQRDRGANIARSKLSASVRMKGKRTHGLPLVSSAPCRDGRLYSRRRDGVDSATAHKD